MRLNKDFEIVEVAGENMAVPLGEEAASLNGVVALSSAAAYLLRQLIEDRTREELLELLLQEYDVKPEVAEEDLSKFLEELTAIGLILE